MNNPPPGIKLSFEVETKTKTEMETEKKTEQLQGPAQRQRGQVLLELESK